MYVHLDAGMLFPAIHLINNCCISDMKGSKLSWMFYDFLFCFIYCSLFQILGK